MIFTVNYISLNVFITFSCFKWFKFSLNQVSVRIGSPITGYGQESRNRAARQRIPNRIWTDEDGVEHVEVNFHIRGPRGAGNVYTEMFRDKVDKQWKFTYLIVEIKSPSPAKLMLESYVPA
ncbi:probable mitochondrial import inner membrane translocase subunit TIM21 [Camellia sinensis]|uniref:probable mitochondrial import inner membrane translocase subunit TIM21 n=1 Tax=Camellia sinensis TaxID=4442 RepID=UPI001036B05B|nr:probable mitochondrial import inner membrane translocase subunit TIM21 [Camellia sinensis]